MDPSHRSRRHGARVGQAGFALVATLTCMVLLMVLSVGMMTLSAITVRKTGRDAARLEAEANARMALMTRSSPRRGKEPRRTRIG